MLNNTYGVRGAIAYLNRSPTPGPFTDMSWRCTANKQTGQWYAQNNPNATTWQFAYLLQPNMLGGTYWPGRYNDLQIGNWINNLATPYVTGSIYCRSPNVSLSFQ